MTQDSTQISADARTYTEADNMTLNALQKDCERHSTFGQFGVDRCECSGCARIRMIISSREERAELENAAE